MQEKEIVNILNDNLVKVRKAISYVNSASSYSRNSATTMNCSYASSSLREVEDNLTGLINELSKNLNNENDSYNEDLSM